MRHRGLISDQAPGVIGTEGKPLPPQLDEGFGFEFLLEAGKRRLMSFELEAKPVPQ